VFPLTLTTIALVILLYGAAWHDEPARPTVIERRARPTPNRVTVQVSHGLLTGAGTARPRSPAS